MIQEKVICCNCEEREALEDYPTALCKNCRDAYIKYPIPIWIKLVSVIIFVIMIFSLMNFRSSLTAAVNYERGLSAEKELKYLTAQNSYKKSLDQFPESELLKSRLFIASVKGSNLDESDKIYNEILEMTYYNDDLLNEVQSAVDLYEKHFFITDELEKIINDQSLSMNEMITALENLIKSNENENIGGIYYYLGSAYYENGEYEKSISALDMAYSINPEIYFFKIPKSIAYRELGNYEKAKEVAKETFNFNKEYPAAYISLSFINLEEHKYEEALKNAQQAYSLDENTLDSVVGLVVSNHYLKNYDERDKYMKILEDNNYYNIDRIKDIINGKIKDYE